MSPRPLALPLLAALLAGCPVEEELPTPEPSPLEGLCPAEESPLLELAHEGDYGDLGDGAALSCSTPPQGGAPYTPFRMRLTGLDGARDGVWVLFEVTDATTGELLGEADLTMGVTCANVGSDAGSFVGSEVHVRYYGLDLDALDGREVVLTASTEAIETGARATAQLQATLEVM